MRFPPVVALLLIVTFSSVGCSIMQTQSNDCPTCRQMNPRDVSSSSGMFGPISCNDQSHSGDCCSGFMSCIYGRLVSDGFGGTIRVYGYPRFGCRGTPPCIPSCE